MSTSTQEIIDRLNNDRKNFYEKLDVDPKASLETIQTKLKDIVSQLNTHRAPDPDEESQVMSAFQQVIEAKNKFRDNTARIKYDQELKLTAPSVPISMSSVSSSTTPVTTDILDADSTRSTSPFDVQQDTLTEYGEVESLPGNLNLDNNLARDEGVPEPAHINKIFNGISRELENNPSLKIAIIVPRRAPYSNDLCESVENLNSLPRIRPSDGERRTSTQQIFSSSNPIANMNDMLRNLNGMTSKMGDNWDVRVSGEPFYPKEPKNIKFGDDNYSQEEFFRLMLDKLKNEPGVDIDAEFRKAKVVPVAQTLTEPLPAATMTRPTAPDATTTLPLVNTITATTTTFTAQAPTSDWPSIVTAYNRVYTPPASPDNNRLDFPSIKDANEFLTKQATDEPHKKFICRGAGPGGTPQQDYFMVSLGDGKIHMGTAEQVQDKLIAASLDAGNDYQLQKEILKNRIAVEKSIHGETPEYHALNRQLRSTESRPLSAEATTERPLAARNELRESTTTEYDDAPDADADAEFTSFSSARMSERTSIAYGQLPALDEGDDPAEVYGSTNDNTDRNSEYGVLPTMGEGDDPSDDYDAATVYASRTSQISEADTPAAKNDDEDLDEANDSKMVL